MVISNCGIITYSRAFTRRRVFSISSASMSQVFSISARRTIFGRSSARVAMAPSSWLLVSAKPYACTVSCRELSSTVMVGTCTERMFFLPSSSLACRAGYSTASSSAWGSITARARAKFPSAWDSSASTSLRSCWFSRMIRINCRTISSRLSLSSLWPRLAVTRRFLMRVSSIRVGFTRSADAITWFPPSSAGTHPACRHGYA